MGPGLRCARDQAGASAGVAPGARYPMGPPELTVVEPDGPLGAGDPEHGERDRGDADREQLVGEHDGGVAPPGAEAGPGELVVGHVQVRPDAPPVTLGGRRRRGGAQHGERTLEHLEARTGGQVQDQRSGDRGGEQADLEQLVDAGGRDAQQRGGLGAGEAVAGRAGEVLRGSEDRDHDGSFGSRQARGPDWPRASVTPILPCLGANAPVHTP